MVIVFIEHCATMDDSESESSDIFSELSGNNDSRPVSFSIYANVIKLYTIIIMLLNKAGKSLQRTYFSYKIISDWYRKLWSTYKENKGCKKCGCPKFKEGSF